MFFRRRRRQGGGPRTARNTAQTGAQGRRTGARPWIDHGLTNGETVSCESCGRALVVRLQRQTSVLVGTTDSLRELPLICVECGRLLCYRCAGTGLTPSCDECGNNVVPPMSEA